MSNTLKIKRGLAADIDKAGVIDGELKYTKDDNKLYIGDGEKNVLINVKSIINVDSDEDLPELSAENMNILYYSKSSEKYFYQRHIGGTFIYRQYNYKENPTFNVDSSQYLYQHTTDTDQWFSPSRKTTNIPCEVIEGTITPSGTYDEGTMVVCYQDNDNVKLFKYTGGTFVEYTNFDACNFDDISLSSCENDTYYYFIPKKRLAYFEHTDWTELFPIKYNSTDRPPLDYGHTDKLYVTLLPELVAIVTSSAPPLKWETIQGSVELAALKSLFEGNFDGKFDVEEYPSYGTLSPSEDTMGAIYYNKTLNIYKITSRKSVTSTLIADNKPDESSSSDDEITVETIKTFQKGLYADRPSASGWGCVVYYATDTQKYYRAVENESSWGMITYTWKEITVKSTYWKPDATAANIGYYIIDYIDFCEIYEVAGTYEWIDLNLPYPYVQVQQSSSTSSNDTFYFKRLELYYDEKDVDSMTEGYIYGVIEDAES